jgi:hypothetical protein
VVILSVSFTRFAETIHCKEEKRVVSITVKLLLEDCTGTVYFTDIQAQEGDRLTGYTINTETMLQKFRQNNNIVPVRFYNCICQLKNGPHFQLKSGPLNQLFLIQEIVSSNL